MTSSLFIALLALCFSVLSFWWIHARTGRLRLASTPVFAGVWGRHRGRPEITLRLPLSLFNSGAKARVVEDLRLFVPSWKGEARLQWERVAATIDPSKGTDLVEDFPAPFAIDPRRVELRYADFTYEFPAELPEARPTLFVLQARLDGRDRWEEVGEVHLHLGHMIHPDTFLPYRNTPTLCPGETEADTTDRWVRHVEGART